MDKKVRRYWSGRLHPGDIVFYRSVRCQVAGDFQFSKKVEVPPGRIPVFYNVLGGKVSPVFTVPLDDADVFERK
jgi:hypothetical protein